MAIVDRPTLKGYFNAGDVPQESNYINLMDSIPILNVSGLVTEKPADATATPTANKIPIADANGKLDDGWITKVAWTDYSSISTIVGWSSYTYKKIYYKKIGKLVFVQFRLEGTSNSTSTSFTLPYTINSNVDLFQLIYGADNNVQLTALMGAYATGSQAIFYKDLGGGGWTASGTKAVRGQFWYEATS